MPETEVLLASRFLSAVSPWRNRTKRVQDIADMATIYLHVGPASLDRVLMLELSALVYPGAEKEYAALLDEIEKGDPIET
jgi:hypothetical protein